MEHVISFPELTTKELNSYSLARGIRAFTNRSEGPTFETEVSQSAQDALPSVKRAGLWCPTQVIFRQLKAGTEGSGKELVPVSHGTPFPWVGPRQPTSILLRLGATLITDTPLPAEVPRVVSGSTARWVTEGAAVDDEEGFSFNLIELGSHLLTANIITSKRLWAQAMMERFLRNDISRALELAWDRAAFRGTGLDGEPTSILSTDGILSVAASGAPSWAHLVEAERKVGDANAEGGRLGFAASPQIRELLRKTQKATGAGMAWESDGTIAGYPAEASSSVPGDDYSTPAEAHELVFGDWSACLVVVAPFFQLLIDEFTLKRQGLIEVSPFAIMDIALRFPESFCKFTGVTTGG